MNATVYPASQYPPPHVESAWQFACLHPVHIEALQPIEADGVGDDDGSAVIDGVHDGDAPTESVAVGVGGAR